MIVCKLMLGTVLHFWACREIPTIIVFHSGKLVMSLYMYKETCHLGGVAQQTCTCDSIVA